MKQGKELKKEECKYTKFHNNNDKYMSFGVDGEYDCLISIPVTDEVPKCIKEKLNEMLYTKMNEMSKKYYGDFPDPEKLDLDARLQINCDHLKGTQYFVSAVITKSDPDVSLFDIFESWDYEVEGETEIEKQFINYCKSKLNEKFFK